MLLICLVLLVLEDQVSVFLHLADLFVAVLAGPAAGDQPQAITLVHDVCQLIVLDPYLKGFGFPLSNVCAWHPIISGLISKQ